MATFNCISNQNGNAYIEPVSLSRGDPEGHSGNMSNIWRQLSTTEIIFIARRKSDDGIKII